MNLIRGDTYSHAVVTAVLAPILNAQPRKYLEIRSR